MMQMEKKLSGKVECYSDEASIECHSSVEMFKFKNLAFLVISFLGLLLVSFNLQYKLSRKFLRFLNLNCMRQVVGPNMGLVTFLYNLGRAVYYYSESNAKKQSNLYV